MKRATFTTLFLMWVGISASQCQAQATIVKRAQAQVTIVTGGPNLLPIPENRADILTGIPPQRDPRILEMFRKQYRGLARNRRHHVHTLSNGHRILVDVNHKGRIVGWGYSNLSGRVILDPGGNLLELNPSQVAAGGKASSQSSFQRKKKTKKQRLQKCGRDFMLCTMRCGSFFGKAVIKSKGNIFAFFVFLVIEAPEADSCQDDCDVYFDTCKKRA